MITNLPMTREALLLYPIKRVNVKIELFDNDRIYIDEVTGHGVSASIDISSESDIRRTCSLVLNLDSDAYSLYSFRTNWINRLVKVSYSLTPFDGSEPEWYSTGYMLMTNINDVVGVSSRTFSFSLSDQISAITNIRGSQLGYDHLIPVGSSIKGAIEATIAEYSPFKRSSVPEFEDVVPYDIVTSVGDYPISIVNSLLSLFPYYEKFYDNDGVFTVREIPTKINDPVDIDKDIIDPLLISENISLDLSKIKNTTEIWGRSLSAEYVASQCIANGDTYELTIDDTFESMIENATYGFAPDVVSVAGQKINIQGLGAYSVVVEAGTNEYVPIEIGALDAGRYYIFKYIDALDGKFVLQGQAAVHVIVQEVNEMPSLEAQTKFKNQNDCPDVRWVVNPESPFACVENIAYSMEREVRQVLKDGEYADIYTTELAFKRAAYENWRKTRLQDTVDLEMIFIPWMDVNDKISYTSPTTGEVGVWLVQSISIDLAKWTMNVKCSRFVEQYPWV